MARSVKVYEAVRGEEVISGTAQEVAAQIGASKYTIWSIAQRGGHVFGWRVREAGVKDRHMQYAAYHISDVFREDPVVGDAEEVAEVIGINNITYFQNKADTGRVTKNGYYIERVKGGDRT